MSVYVIAQGKVENRGLLDQYVAKVILTIESHQGRVVAFDEVPEVVEGPIEHPRTVILEFPSMTAFHAWYDSPEYQEILPLRLKTAALQRNEHNSTMAQWTVIRQAIAGNRDIAELMTAGLHGERSMDPADQLRLEQMLAECAWAAFHIWDRTQRGVFPKGTFELTAGPFLCDVLKTARGGTWWRSAKYRGFIPEFVLDVDAALAKDSGASVASP